MDEGSENESGRLPLIFGLFSSSFLLQQARKGREER